MGSSKTAELLFLYTGYIPTQCWDTKLDVNKSYIVVASRKGTTYRAADTEIVSSNLNNVIQACRLEPKYPFGKLAFYANCQ